MDGRRGGRVAPIRHPDQLWWPALGLRKRDVVRYYLDVAPALLPHLRGRPFTFRQHFNGPRSPFRWLKDAPAEAPDWLRVVELPAKSRGGGPVRYAVLDDEASLAWAVDYGCVDLHAWASRVDRPERPDWVLFDLDPAGVGWTDVVAAARLLREALAALDLVSVVKTTGGAGLHVHVPVARRHSFEDARAFAGAVADALARASGGMVTTERSLARRHGVYVDTKMNGHGQQVVAPYSVRPLPGAPVATPVSWAEVDDSLDPRAFTPDVVRRRVAAHGDLLAGALSGRQLLGRALASLGP